MKKKLISLVTIAAITTLSASAALAGPGIRGTVHNIGQYLKDHGVTKPNEPYQRICAGCHTPHHSLTPDMLAGIPNAPEYTPLWSHAVDLNPYAPYANAVYNVRVDGLQADDPLIGPSRLCMSCHDGVIAVDSYYQPLPGVQAFTENTGTFVIPGGNDFGGANVGIGPNGPGDYSMARNHPIGFDFKTFIGDPARTLNEFQTMGPTTGFVGNDTVKVFNRLYTPIGSSGGYMTCATCHDVHNKLTPDSETAMYGAQWYFALAPQLNSAICITCHAQAGPPVP